MTHLDCAGILGDGRGKPRNRSRTEGSRTRQDRERIVNVPVKHIQLLSERLVDTDDNLVVVEGVRNRGLQRVRIETRCDVSCTWWRRNQFVYVVEVGLRSRRDVRYLG